MRKWKKEKQQLEQSSSSSSSNSGGQGGRILNLGFLYDKLERECRVDRMQAGLLRIRPSDYPDRLADSVREVYKQRWRQQLLARQTRLQQHLADTTTTTTTKASDVLRWERAETKAIQEEQAALDRGVLLPTCRVWQELAGQLPPCLMLRMER